MQIKDLGYTIEDENYRIQNGLQDFLVGRITLEHKDRYTIKSEVAEYDAELLGNLRYSAESRHDLPAVGDWVAFSEYDDHKALIHVIFPRRSIIERKAVGQFGQIQIIATNVDYGLIIQAVDRDFNLNRLERYLTICYASKVEPIVVLSKIDLINSQELSLLVDQIKERMKDVLILTISNQENGYESVNQIIKKGKTYCLLGSSGVGKSTLLNNLSNDSKMETGAISTSVNKGRHITSHRELIVLDEGGILIDNPGMREVGLADSSDGLETTFETILEIAENCRFKDCTHSHERGCAVIKAIEEGEIDENAYSNYKKMEKEKEHFESDAVERRKKDKDFGKMVKSVIKQKKKNKF